MAIYSATLSPELNILRPGTGLGPQADEQLEALHSRGFVAATGLTEYHAGSVAVMITQPHIVEYCSSDMKRLGTLARARVWHAKEGGRGPAGIYTANADGAALSPAEVDKLTQDELRMVAYGWSGHLHNDHIPGADITTAYRVGEEGRRLARERRTGLADTFKLGRPLGVLVVASAIHLHGAKPEEISLDVWGSNLMAIGLYEDLGFVLQDSEPSVRPTLRAVGDVIFDGEHDQVVFEAEHDGQRRRMVHDIRHYYQNSLSYAEAA